ncbi:MAG: DNA methyltransferase [Sphingomonas sp.]
MSAATAYADFIAAKAVQAPDLGLPVQAGAVNPLLHRHQPVLVKWLVEGGRRALFANFGLGKTIIQLETMRLVREAVAALLGGKVVPALPVCLIIIPLTVKVEFQRDAAMLGTPVRFVRTTAEILAALAEDFAGLFLTNYESVREGKIDTSILTAVSLDEASCLRGFGGTKTFREFMAILAGDDRRGGGTVKSEGIPYRFVATATPSPNEYIELLAYAAFLGIMDVGQAKTRFFKRNSEKADQLTLHPHKEDEFWLWVNSWAAFIQRPSDLGFSDEGYDLPPLDVRWHEVASDHSKAGSEADGQKRMFKAAAIGVVDASREKRESLSARIGKMLELRAEDPEAHRLIWHDLEAERQAIEDAVPSRWFGHWGEVKDGNPTVCAVYDRHYSSRTLGEDRKLALGPGEKMALLSGSGDAIFGWRKFIDDSGQRGVNCAFFRNESDIQSSELIQHAMAAAWDRWPGQRLYTFVDAEKTEHRRGKDSAPGKCFIEAGWRRCGETKGGLIVLEALAGTSIPEVARRPGLVSVYGAQPLSEREQAIIRFSDGEVQELAAKPVLAGSGCNFQRHCAWAIFLGIGFKFNDFIQAIHRIQRFLQTRAVRIDLIYTEAERSVRASLEGKWRRHEDMCRRMSEIIRTYGLGLQGARDMLSRSIGVQRREERGDAWTIVNQDTVEETAAMAADSVDLIVTSIPFSTQYEYTPSYNDFGHTDDDAHFFAQLGYLTPELIRVLKPGRVACVHVKDRIRPGGLDGVSFQSVSPFHADCIAHYRRHGLFYMGMITVVTDVVRENNATYRLGWSMQCDDGSRMSVGLPEYVLLFRKAPTDNSDGYADEPVTKSKADFTRARWQLDAHAFWRSQGNRLLEPEDLLGRDTKTVYRTFRGFSAATVYDFGQHERIAQALDDANQLPTHFMTLPPVSWHEDVWSDVTRMRTLNGDQVAKGRERHLCPLQFDIVDRLIHRFSGKGELVFDPFGGLMTVPLRAMMLGRRGRGHELNPLYFDDAVRILREADHRRAIPDLFGIVEGEASAEAAGDDDVPDELEAA